MKRKILRFAAILIVCFNLIVMGHDLWVNGLSGTFYLSLPTFILGIFAILHLSDTKPMVPKTPEEQKKSKETQEKIQDYLANNTKVR